MKVNPETIHWVLQSDVWYIQQWFLSEAKVGLGMTKELSFTFIYSWFEKGFMYMATGTGKLCVLFTLLHTNKMDKKPWFVHCKFSFQKSQYLHLEET